MIKSIIAQKKQGKNLTQNEIAEIINSYIQNKIDDKQMTSFLKAVFKKGMSQAETYFLTKAMQNSGKTFDFKGLGTVVDKHSTGGVGDNTSLIIVPILASLGTKVFKISGGGLGFTGGTADKILQFKGIKNQLEFKEAKKVLQKTNACFLTQTDDIVPADKKIYALRNKTGLIQNVPLIASSIVSKKLACGANIVLLDVKFGDGAFMKNYKNAEDLAVSMVEILKKENKKTCAVLTSMEEPLGDFVGDQLEVREAIKTLQGKTKNNLQKLSVLFASKLFSMAKNISFKDAKNQVLETIKNGNALKKLEEIVVAQSGIFELPKSKIQAKIFDVKSTKNGFVKKIKTENLGYLCKEVSKNFPQFLGVEIKKRTGEKIEKNDNIFLIYSNNDLSKKIINKFKKCVVTSKEKINKIKLIEKIIE
ncbi:MAG: thymidine phosphorylase [Clostridia bacterium]|nr:thymidine phosphorylase [Clostridia bacterium]